MKYFAELFKTIDETTSTNAKINALVHYFEKASAQDKVWTIAVFSHKRPSRGMTTTQLRTWAADFAKIPSWLFDETYHIVGDLAETIAKVLPPPTETSHKSLSEWINYLMSIKKEEDTQKKSMVIQAWSCLAEDERFLFNKLLTGGFRMGVAQKTIAKALAKHLGQDENTIAFKLMGNWDPNKISFEDLLINDNPIQNLSKPYPFYLAYALDIELKELGSPQEWMAEYKWDGIRGQLIKRGENVFLWSRGEELITNQFPEFEKLAQLDFDFVFDGEILVSKNNSIGSFNDLQKRLGRKKVSKKMLAEFPAFIMLYDLFELDREDTRILTQQERRSKLESLFSKFSEDLPVKISENISFSSWSQLTELRKKARALNAEGLMLKSTKGIYKTGRKKGDWYKWKVDPMTIDAVMLYAQRGHGRRSNLYSDFTFALKDGDALVPFAKAYSGLTDEEFVEITKFVKKNTKERFGPVSSVTPVLVFEIAFEGIAESKRHKSGVALRFPRIKRWRKDKKVNEINTLDDIKKLLPK